MPWDSKGITERRYYFEPSFDAREILVRHEFIL